MLQMSWVFILRPSEGDSRIFANGGAREVFRSSIGLGRSRSSLGYFISVSLEGSRLSSGGRRDRTCPSDVGRSNMRSLPSLCVLVASVIGPASHAVGAYIHDTHA